MFATRLKKKHRGQIRAVDFVVSLLLFLLMMSQLILIIFNVQSGILSSNVSSITYEDLDLFGRSLLQLKGDPYWGYQQSLPNAFGLADDDSKAHLALDASKISRIITGTSFPIFPVSGFQTFDYFTLKDTINLESDFDFQLAFYPCLEINMSISIVNSTANLISIIATNPNKLPVSGANAHFYTINLTNGKTIYEGKSITNHNGEANKTYLIPHINDPDGEHFTYVIIEKKPLWGIDWYYYDPTPFSESVIIGNPSDTTLWACGINSSTLLICDVLTSTPELHFLSIIYENAETSFSQFTIDLGNQVEANETISIPNEGLVAFFSIAKVNNVFHVGIGTFPSILDYNLNMGSYYSIFGNLNPSESVKSMLSKIYPIIVRGTIMICQLTLWSE